MPYILLKGNIKKKEHQQKKVIKGKNNAEILFNIKL